MERTHASQDASETTPRPATRVLRTVRGALALVVAAVGTLGTVTPAAAAEPASVDRPTVTAEDGTQWGIDAVNTGRGAGMLVKYTPDYGFSTFTNPWGAEAVLEPTATPNTYRVLSVGSALRDTATSGSSAIPADGFVLSAGPGGDPDPVAFLTDHVAAGDLLTITRPTSLDEVRAASAVDPTPESNPDGAAFPGYRGGDQLIVYTPEFGQSTGTNEWGFELVVRDGVVASIGGANTTIPADGVVLSGHGTAADFLRRNGLVGASVEIDGTSVRIHSDVATTIGATERDVAAVEDVVRTRRADFVDGDLETADAALERAHDLIDDARESYGSDDQVALYYTDQAAAAAREAYYASAPSRVAEARGVWYRPEERTAEAIRRTIARMQATGVNELYLETFWSGYTIYPSEVAESYGLPAQRPEFAGFDPLAVWKREADAAGIAVHAWIDGLAVGNQLGDGVGPIVERHPEWLAVARDQVDADGATPSFNGFYWLDVSDDEAHRYFLDVTAEMVDRYDLAGINLDYMRYPSDGDWQHAYNFSDDARAAFAEQEGVDPLTIDPADDAEAWRTFTTFVDEEENGLVGDIYRRVKSDDPTVVVSDAPEAGTEADKIDQWKDVLDVVIPQAYTTNLDSIRQRVEKVLTHMTGGQLVYTGLSAMYERGGADATVRQTEAAKHLDTGSVIFAFGQAGPAHVEALSSGPWRDPAVSPGQHPVAATHAVLADARENIADRYVPQGGMERSAANEFTRRLAAVDRVLGERPTDGQVSAALDVLAGIAADVEEARAGGQVGAAVAARLTESLDDCTWFLEYALARDMR